MLYVKNGVPVYENTGREDADIFIACPKNVLFYIMRKAWRLSLFQRDTVLVTLPAENLNQIQLTGIMPFNTIEL